MTLHPTLVNKWYCDVCESFVVPETQFLEVHEAMCDKWTKTKQTMNGLK